MDGFNRADAPTLGPQWEDPDNAWTINNSNALSVDPGVAIFQVPHPVPSESMHAYFTTIDEVDGSGMKYRVIVNAVDENSYHFVEFERRGTNTSILRLGQGSGGTSTIIKEDIIVGLTGTTRQVIATIAHNEFCGSVSNAALSLVSTEPSIIGGGYYSGIEAVDTGMRIDDHTFEHHMYTRDECANCLCFCENEYIPPVLNARLTGTGRLDGLDVDITLEWDRLDARWEGESGNVCSPGQNWRLIFFCPQDRNNGGTATLAVDFGCTSSDGFGTAPRFPVNYSCDPLEWEFGPYNVSIFDLACGCGLPFSQSGTYTIVVTET